MSPSGAYGDALAPALTQAFHAERYEPDEEMALLQRLTTSGVLWASKGGAHAMGDRAKVADGGRWPNGRKNGSKLAVKERHKIEGDQQKSPPVTRRVGSSRCASPNALAG